MFEVFDFFFKIFWILFELLLLIICFLLDFVDFMIFFWLRGGEGEYDFLSFFFVDVFVMLFWCERVGEGDFWMMIFFLCWFIILWMIWCLVIVNCFFICDDLEDLLVGFFELFFDFLFKFILCLIFKRLWGCLLIDDRESELKMICLFFVFLIVCFVKFFGWYILILNGDFLIWVFCYFIEIVWIFVDMGKYVIRNVLFFVYW